MNNINTSRLLTFVFGFSFLFTVVHFVVSYGFLWFQEGLAEDERIALELYAPFRKLSLITWVGQFLRGMAFVLILHPFYTACFKSNRSFLLLFMALFGLGLAGSVEPQPGSIEGMLYTLTSVVEHVSVLLAVAIQMALFIFIFLRIQRRLSSNMDSITQVDLYPYKRKLKGYLIRFTTIHLFTYWVVGSIFYEVSGYQQALETMDIFILWRPLENLTAVFIIFFGQIFRGILLGLLLHPFYQFYIDKRLGWLKLFMLLAGLTILGSPLFLTELISFNGSFVEFWHSLSVGIPEIFSQMLIFSLLFFYWQKHIEHKGIR